MIECKKRGCGAKIDQPPEYTVPAMQHIPERDVYVCPKCKTPIYVAVKNA